jgi:hypothetical protein
MKKYALCVMLTTFLLKVEAQQNIKIDTIYYQVDVRHTPDKERMWDIFIESTTNAS